MATPSDSFSDPGGSFSDRIDRDNDPFDRNKRKKDPRLPPEFADLILEDGRRLGDVLGAGAFGISDRRERRSDALGRIAAERLAQANRLGFTQSILKGKPPEAGFQTKTAQKGSNDFGGKFSEIFRRRRNG